MLQAEETPNNKALDKQGVEVEEGEEGPGIMQYMLPTLPPTAAARESCTVNWLSGALLDLHSALAPSLLPSTRTSCLNRLYCILSFVSQ